MNEISGADPGLPVGGGGTNPRWSGHQPPTQALFGENICKNERIWSCWGGGCRKLLYVDPPLNLVRSMYTAIVRAIEMDEYTWDSNFDGFENMVTQQSIRLELDKLQKEKDKTTDKIKRNLLSRF